MSELTASGIWVPPHVRAAQRVIRARPNLSHWLSGLINTGMLNTGHSLVNAGVIRAAAAAFMPPLTASLVLYVRGDYGLWTDTGGTTPATNNGDLIARWTDYSGNNNHLTQATSGNRAAVLNNTLGGKTIVNFTAGSRFYNLSSEIASTPLTAYYVIYNTSFAGFPPLFSGIASALEYYIKNDGKQQLDSASSAAIASATNALSTSTWTQVGMNWERPGKGYTFRKASAANGNGTGATQPGLATGIDYIGKNALATYFPGYMAMCLLYNVVHSTSEMQQMEAWQTATYSGAV